MCTLPLSGDGAAANHDRFDPQVLTSHFNHVFAVVQRLPGPELAYKYSSLQTQKERARRRERKGERR